MITDNKPCTKCRAKRKGLNDNECPFCLGQRFFEPVDAPKILGDIYTTRGRGKGNFRVTPPKMNGSVLSHRTYYVWRMARFHGGIDMAMPVKAEIMIEGDPFVKELKTLSEKLAKVEFGTSTAAIERWKGILG